MTHIDAIAGLLDCEPDTREWMCRFLARYRPGEAVWNAENYARFAQAVYMREHGLLRGLAQPRDRAET
jgi:hypothetical protein